MKLASFIILCLALAANAFTFKDQSKFVDVSECAQGLIQAEWESFKLSKVLQADGSIKTFDVKQTGEATLALYHPDINVCITFSYPKATRGQKAFIALDGETRGLCINLTPGSTKSRISLKAVADRTLPPMPVQVQKSYVIRGDAGWDSYRTIGFVLKYALGTRVLPAPKNLVVKYYGRVPNASGRPDSEVAFSATWTAVPAAVSYTVCFKGGYANSGAACGLQMTFCFQTTQPSVPASRTNLLSLRPGGSFGSGPVSIQQVTVTPFTAGGKAGASTTINTSAPVAAPATFNVLTATYFIAECVKL
eukprot:Colp12_sorted_trinity150504_noHs@9800